jgi:heme oxygenase
MKILPLIETNGRMVVRTLLRRATHDQHILLNKHAMLADLTSPDLALPVYRMLLIAYAYLYQSVEARIEQFLTTYPDIFDYTVRRKLPWLRADLEFFQIDMEVADPDVPLMRAPEITQLGQLVGVLYVIEGSTLGAQFISRHLQEHHGLGDGGGARFFTGYGENTQLRWQEFIEFSQIISSDAVQCQAAEQAACQIFQLFNQVLDVYHQKLVR